MYSEEDIKVAQTSIVEQSLTELFNFIEQLEQQVKHKQYCCPTLSDTSNTGKSTALYVSDRAKVECLETAITD